MEQKIRFVKQAGIYTIGTVLNVNKPVADLYVQRGVAVLVESEMETAMVGAAETAVKKRGRPKGRRRVAQSR